MVNSFLFKKNSTWSQTLFLLLEMLFFLSTLCVCMRTYVYTCVRETKVNAGYLPFSLSVLLYDTESLLNLKLAVLHVLTGHQASSIHQCQGHKCTQSCLAFMWMLRSWTQGLVLVQQAPDPLSEALSPALQLCTHNFFPTNLPRLETSSLPAVLLL